MLEKGLEVGVVTRLTNMHLGSSPTKQSSHYNTPYPSSACLTLWGWLSDHFEVANTPHEYSTTTLPYFEGDYWPGVAEDFIKQIDEKEKKKKKEDKKTNGKGKAKAKAKAKGSKKGTRSSGPASKHEVQCDGSSSSSTSLFSSFPLRVRRAMI